MSRQTITQRSAASEAGSNRARDASEDHAETPLQLMSGPAGVGTTALSALMASGGNIQMAQLNQRVQRSADKEGAEGGGEDKLRLVVSVLENKLGRELKGADVKVVRDQLQGREADPTHELVRDLLPMLGGEEPVQQRATGGPVQRSATGGGEDTGAVHAAAARGIAGGGGSLPYAEQIQQSFGRHDVSGVKGHVGGPAREASEAMGAEAYATGDHVAFKGQPDLHTAAHEAAHVVQQRAGVSLKGGVGQVGDPYERHADAVADRVVQGKSAEDLLDQMARGGGGKNAVQKQAAKSASKLSVPWLGDLEIDLRRASISSSITPKSVKYGKAISRELPLANGILLSAGPALFVAGGFEAKASGNLRASLAAVEGRPGIKRLLGRIGVSVSAFGTLSVGAYAGVANLASLQLVAGPKLSGEASFNQEFEAEVDASTNRILRWTWRPVDIVVPIQASGTAKLQAVWTNGATQTRELASFTFAETELASLRLCPAEKTGGAPSYGTVHVSVAGGDVLKRTWRGTEQVGAKKFLNVTNDSQRRAERQRALNRGKVRKPLPTRLLRDVLK